MQRKLTVLACFFILATIGTSKCFSQLRMVENGGHYPFVQYTPKDGLVNSRVRKAYQDSKGRIYFLTFSGLSVYDGLRFKNYTTENGLSSDLVNDILELGNDSFLVATNTNSVNVLSNGKMSVLKIPGKFCPLVNQFYRNDQNEIYVSSDDGLFKFTNNRFEELNILPLVSNDVTSPYLGAITGRGNYLIFMTNELKKNTGLYLYDIRTNRVCDFLNDQIIVGIAKDLQDNVWISVSGHLFILDNNALANGRLSFLHPPPLYADASSFPFFDQNGMWFIHNNKKMMRIEKNAVVSNMFLPEQIGLGGGVTSILVDRENTIWLCNDGAGVFKLANSRLQIFENPAGKKIPTYFYQAFPAKNGTWYNSASNKLFRQSFNGLTAFTCNLSLSPYLFEQRDEKLLGYDLRNVYEGSVNEKTRHVYFRKLVSLPDTDNFGRRLVIDKEGNLIAALHTGIGVWRANKLIFHASIPAADLIEELAFDKNNLLWVVGRYKDIEGYSLHPENPSHYLQSVFPHPPAATQSSPRCFVIDKTGLLWIGTRTSGLVVYKYEDQELTRLYHFYTANGLSDNFVTALSCDSSNNILVGTQTGLDRIVRDTNSFRIENLTRSSNFFAFINQVWTDASNKSYAITNTGGLLRLSPVASNTGGFTPQLLIEELRVNAQSVLQKKNIFGFKENNLSFLVAAPSFVDERQVSFSYLLEGSGNEHWSDTTTGNAVINLINLSPGKYVLRVKAFFPSTPYPPSATFFAFQITPPWWRTGWFRILLAISVATVTIYFIRFYYRGKLEKQRLIFEKQKAIEVERGRIAADMHDDLGAGLTKIKFITDDILEKTQAGVSLEPDLEKLKNSSSDLIESMGEIIWAMSEKNNLLSDTLYYLRSYAVSYCEENDLVCQFDVPQSFKDGVVSGNTRRNIFLLLKESLHNIVKHAAAKSVVIKISVGERLELIIKDDGKGFVYSENSVAGNGVINMKKRVNDLQGLIRFENTNGTIVTVQLPITTNQSTIA